MRYSPSGYRASKIDHSNALYEDPERDNLGRYRRLLRLDRTIEQFTYYAITSDTSHLARNFIRSVAPNDSGNLWLGTYDDVVRWSLLAGYRHSTADRQTAYFFRCLLRTVTQSESS